MENPCVSLIVNTQFGGLSTESQMLSSSRLLLEGIVRFWFTGGETAHWGRFLASHE